MKLAKIESYTNEFVCFVRITTDDGRTGWGQVAPYYADITATVLHRMVAPHALGLDALDIDAMVDLVIEREHKFPGSFLRRAIGGIDTALWDMRGKLEGRSVCEMLGGTPGEVRAYASSMKRDITEADEATRFIKLRDQYGFDAFKFRVGAECGHDVDEWPVGQSLHCWSMAIPDFHPPARSNLDITCKTMAFLILKNLARIGNTNKRWK